MSHKDIHTQQPHSSSPPNLNIYQDHNNMGDLTIHHQEVVVISSQNMLIENGDSNIELPKVQERSSSSKGITTTKNDKNREKIVANNIHLPLGIYSEGEKVLAFYNHQIYEAKVQKAESMKNKWRYHVHYIGWNTKWNEWVDEDRLMKHTQENLMKKQALDKNQNVEKHVKFDNSGQMKAEKYLDSNSDKDDTKSNVSKMKKRKNVAEVEKGNVTIKKSINIQIPAKLNKQLMNDWNFVTQQDTLVRLPRSPTIDEILTKYLECKSKKDSKANDSIGEFLTWIRRNFDRALPMMLLYTKEHKQYNEAIVDGVSPSTVYGAEHLLRLFAKLPELLAYLNIEEETLNRLQQIFIDFLKFLQRRKSTLFLSAYDGPKVYELKGDRNEE